MNTFDFDFDPKFRPILLALSARPDNSFVALTDDGDFHAKFGWWQVRTPISNIKGWQRSGDYRWYRAIGIRASFADHGLTFGSNTREGLCVCFKESVPALVIGPSHPGLTVTVADVDGLAAALVERGVSR